jgi:signal transduction histidine kinase
MRVGFINPAGSHILGLLAQDIVGKELYQIEPGLLPSFTQIETEQVPEQTEDDSNPADPDATALSAKGPEAHRSLFVQAKSEKGMARLQQTVEIGKGTQLRILRGDVAELDADAGLGVLLAEQATGGRVLLFQDVTKLLHLEEKLKQHEKLAAVGQLAAGIAHEIRNPLAGISGSIEMLKESMPVGDGYSENHRLMDIAIREIDRLNRLISEFLDFVKPDRFKVEKVELDKLLSELVLAARGSKEFKDRIQVREHYDPTNAALANSSKLRQVIWNLLINAAQAMRRDGFIDVGCGPVGGRRVKLWVEDQGQGMSEDVLAHLYEPFFTTKDKGTGLGLATAYKIIEAHHGEIKVTSQVNIGTRFEVYLPAA